MNSHNDNQKEVLRLVYSLASIHNTQVDADQTIQFVKENWGKFRADYESTSTKERFSTGCMERILFNHIANLCNWKTHLEYMKIASRIMILCGYRSYEKEKRFRQKIQNIKKEKKKNIPRSHQDRPDDLSYEVSSSMNQDMNSISSDDQVTNDVHSVSEQPTMKENEIYEQQLIYENNLYNKHCRPSDEDSVDYSFNSLSDINIDNPLLCQSVNTGFVYNNNLMLQEDNSPWNEPSYISDYLNDPFYIELIGYQAFQPNQSDNIIF